MNVPRCAVLFSLTLAMGVTYAGMAPLSRYLDTDQKAEIALARTAAPPSISDHATVLALTAHGYITAARGTNGFTCLVERSWMKHFEDPGFWNWHMRAPVCYNAAASSSVLPYTIFTTNLVLRGVPKAQLRDRINAAVTTHQLPALQPGSMAYMMSKEQYLTDPDPANGVTATSWHPHVMFYAPLRDAAGDGGPFGANLKGSPVVFDSSGGNPDPFTVFFVPVWKWSDGTPGPLLTMHHAH
jgi:hypothetical protein